MERRRQNDHETTNESGDDEAAGTHATHDTGPIDGSLPAMKSRLTRITLAAIVSVMALASGCGDTDADTNAAGSASTGWEELDGVDVEALAFASDTTAGERFDGAEFVGRDVILWFWAPW